MHRRRAIVTNSNSNGLDLKALTPTCPSTTPGTLDQNANTLLAPEPPLRSTFPMPGVRCPTCLKNGNVVWIIPGKRCYICGTDCEYEY